MSKSGFRPCKNKKISHGCSPPLLHLSTDSAQATPTYGFLTNHTIGLRRQTGIKFVLLPFVRILCCSEPNV